MHLERQRGRQRPRLPRVPEFLTRDRPPEPAAEDATIEGARRNIERHYDLSDDLFALFLDPSMTYSSALFAPRDSLASAQRRKIDALLDRTGTGPGTTILEIGTGWGELAIRAAARGARVTTLTISPSQWRTARRRTAAAGVADRVDVQLRDYREATGRYDVVLSVERIEAGGERRPFRAGDIEHHAPGVLHRIINDGDEVFEFYAIWWDTEMSHKFLANHVDDYEGDN